jgi:DNA-binding MarR family transcriptional regulator
VLRLLRAQHPATMPTLTLANRLVSHAPDITRMLDKLQQRDLIARFRPPDNRRTVLIGITDSGVALVNEIAQPLRQCHQQQLGLVSADDLHQLVRLLQAARRPHEDDASSWR